MSTPVALTCGGSASAREPDLSDWRVEEHPHDRPLKVARLTSNRAPLGAEAQGLRAHHERHCPLSGARQRELAYGALGKRSLRLCVQHEDLASEPRGQLTGRLMVDALGGVMLMKTARPTLFPWADDGDPITPERRSVVMRHEQRGDRLFLEDAPQLISEAAPQLRVQAREGLIEEQERRARGEGPRSATR